MVTINVTVGMTPEMLEKIDTAVENSDFDSRSQYIRTTVKDASASPFEQEGRLTDNE